MAKLASGVGLTGMWFAGSRGLQIGAAIWVTRKLSPDDFEILAVVFAVQGMAQRLTALNLASHLVRSAEVSALQLRSVFSYESLRGLLLFGIVYLAAPFVAGWMDEPEAATVLRISALAFVIGALRNPRLVELRREGRFGLLGAIDSIPLLGYALCSVVFVMFERSYWALVWAGIASSALNLIGTYMVVAWRPGLCFAWRVVEPMFRFGMVLLGNAVCSSFREYGMVFLLIWVGMQDELGYYNRAIAFSLALALQGASVFWRVAYPVFAKAHIEGGDCMKHASKIQGLILLVGMPGALLAAFFGEWIIGLTLGEVWLPIVPIWSWLVVGSVIMLASMPYEVAYQAVHLERRGLGIYAILTALQLVLAFALLPSFGIVGIGIAILVTTTVGIAAFRLAANIGPGNPIPVEDGV